MKEHDMNVERLWHVGNGNLILQSITLLQSCYNHSLIIPKSYYNHTKTILQSYHNRTSIIFSPGKLDPNFRDVGAM